MKKTIFIVTLLLCAALFLAGCQEQELTDDFEIETPQQITEDTPGEQAPTEQKEDIPLLEQEPEQEVKNCTIKYSFYKFTDPNENAFTIQIPSGWEVEDGSGLVRPYIDAGIQLSAQSGQNQEFTYTSPYMVYTTPNQLLDFAGFKEGTYYDPSGGISKPMMVKKYTEASDYLNELAQQENAADIETKDRPDLTASESPLITKQSAAEIRYHTPDGIIHVMVAYTYLIEISGSGIWSANIFSYHSPENLLNETEYLVLQTANSLKVDPTWAQKEAEQVMRRSAAVSSSQESVSESISSSFAYRSDSMDRINNEWSKTTLGIEETYNPDTGDTYFVDSGAKYYWIDNRNNIYGTETSENPFLNEDITPLEIKREV